MPRDSVNFANNDDSNCAPLSVIIDLGTPYLEIQLLIIASATILAVIDLSGMASIHLVFLSIIVSR